MDKKSSNSSTDEVGAQQERERVLKAMILEPKSRWYWHKQPLSMSLLLFGCGLILIATIVFTLTWTKNLLLNEKPSGVPFQKQQEAPLQSTPTPSQKSNIPDESTKPNGVKSPPDGSFQPGKVDSDGDDKRKPASPKESKLPPEAAQPPLFLGPRDRATGSEEGF